MPGGSLALRCTAYEHLALYNESIWPLYVIDPEPIDRYYDRPIAVLTGPGCVSSGDQVALRLTYHPTARVFGKTTAAAFNAPEFHEISPGVNAVVATAERARLDALAVPLTHLEFLVDEPVWLEPDDVAQSRDTVFEAAADWITGRVGITDPSPPAEPDTPVAATRSLGARPIPSIRRRNWSSPSRDRLIASWSSSTWPVAGSAPSRCGVRPRANTG